MKKIQRSIYLDRLIRRKENGMIKVITGIRRCGKSYLLDPLFTDYLRSQGVTNDHIIKLELDDSINSKYLDPHELENYILTLTGNKDNKNNENNNEMYYVILDEIQRVKNFEGVLNGLLYKKNLDIYVTGSNSKFLSSDIITEFRGRGDQVRVNPFSYKEFYDAYQGDKKDALKEYMTYGGMPLAIEKEDEYDKAEYLKGLFEKTYYADIVERYNIKRNEILDKLVEIVASDISSLTNPLKIYNTFLSEGIKDLSQNTIFDYLLYLEDAFLISKAQRYDVKGRKYISTPYKYYFTDIGLRNAKLNFRQNEETHIMENMIYNELLVRGYNVDVGVVEILNKDKEKNKYTRENVEIDFVCNKAAERYYIQSALSLDTREKTIQETRSLLAVKEGFKKIVIVKEDIKPWITEEGVIVMGLEKFLLDPNSLSM